ncbi:hypothetical protein SGRA_0851 [Saprospira grandis str. Lewin]|uniref:Uncharacterized protein n=1 Tax=Saprospira grandis (strain Lewin) TaxID=984262 RepID=H6L250_SAPGL|nr:hypothetical protein SGRA_0851 [Saprospira grandis str. Lewin]
MQILLPFFCGLVQFAGWGRRSRLARRALGLPLRKGGLKGQTEALRAEGRAGLRALQHRGGRPK